MVTWELETNRMISFKETADINKSNVIVNCVLGYLNETIEGDIIHYTLGEGGITEIYEINNLTIVTGGVAIMTQTSLYCPVRLLHEIGHVLGFAHSGNKSSILYPTEDCQQTITPDIKHTVNELYGKAHFPDLYFNDTNVEWVDGYLNVDAVVVNGGVKSSPPAEFHLLVSEEVINKISIEGMKAGWSNRITISNIKLDEPPNEIKLLIDNPSANEISEANNVLILEK